MYCVTHKDGTTFHVEHQGTAELYEELGYKVERFTVAEEQERLNDVPVPGSYRQLNAEEYGRLSNPLHVQILHESTAQGREDRGSSFWKVLRTRFGDCKMQFLRIASKLGIRR